VSDVCGRCGEVALGDGRRSPYHLGRRRDTGQPGETIAIPINTGEQSSLALPPGEGHEPIMDMQLPMRAQSPCPLIVRQVSSHAVSSGCSLPASRSPRAPVREGQRQRLPAPPSALSSLTAQSGMVFAPSVSRRQRSPGKTPWVRVGRSHGPLPLREEDAWPHPSVTQPQAPQRPRAFGGR
jgi:hypothetical protein